MSERRVERLKVYAYVPFVSKWAKTGLTAASGSRFVNKVRSLKEEKGREDCFFLFSLLISQLAFIGGSLMN